MTLPRPTVFISYASEDRTATRLLRDALAAAGLDVWYDENELGGGDAWDQKIRRQIRDCDYFMPVISATTERRKEGYFRREWRLACERTLDMADDVMFLLPVTIDGTGESGARVPEKFLMVQWLRVPAGTPNAALDALARRIATGDHAGPPPLEKPAPLNRPRAVPPAGAAHDGPPPMPPFPHLADNGNKGHGLKFLAEVIWWVITAGWLLLKRGPRWLRIVVSIWFCLWLFARCSRDKEEPNDSKPTTQLSATDKAEARKAIHEAADKLARNIAAEIKDTDNIDKQLIALPFALGVTNEADARFLGAVFTPLYGRLAVERSGETGVAAKPLPAVTDATLVNLGHQLDAGYVLGAHIVAENGAAANLQVRLMKIENGSVAWSAQYPVAGSDPTVVADQIATGVLAAMPKG